MAKSVEVKGKSVRSQDRLLTLTPGQPGRVALTIHVGRKPIAIVVPIAELTAKLDQLPR